MSVISKTVATRKTKHVDAVLKYTRVSPASNVAFSAIFIILALLCFLPALLVAIVSLSSEHSVVTKGYSYIPMSWSVASYAYLLKQGSYIGHAFINSLGVTVVGTVIGLVLCSTMGYALSRPNYRLRGFFTWFIFIPMLFSGGLVASYMINAQVLGLKNTYWALILPICCSSFYIIIMRTFFQTSVPDAIIESAKIDGARQIRIFLQILKLFGLGKRWLILWLFVDWLPLLILGIGKKYQPVKENLREGAVRIPDAEQTAARPGELLNGVVPLAQEGLSIHIRDRVVKDFGKKHRLLRDIALNIPDHSLVLLLGGSGAGKTTLINAVTGYEKADGTILLHGVDVYKDYESVKHKIGFVPQKNLIRAQDTVRRTVGDIAAMRLPKSVSKEERNRMVEDNMDLLGLSAGQNGLVSKKSGGQLRRICIAMELVTDPALFILDEPDSGLDGVISREIFTKLRQIANDGRIVIVITHTPDRVIDLFDRVIVLAKDSAGTGRLAFYGSPGEAREFFEKTPWSRSL